MNFDCRLFHLSDLDLERLTASVTAWQEMRTPPRRLTPPLMSLEVFICKILIFVLMGVYEKISLVV
jgi:hypothetical protein